MLSEFFDVAHYCRQIGQNLTLAKAWSHFQSQGDRSDFDPSPYFSTAFYKSRYRNWNRQDATAFEDFLRRVAKGQMRQPHPLIAPEDYLSTHPDLAGLGAAAVLHFIRHGDREARAPSAGFDGGFYRRCYLPLGQGHPFRHYITEGATQGFLPCPEPRDAAKSQAAMAKAGAALLRPIVLVAHDAQQAGVPILTLDLARALRRRGWDPIFLLGNAGPLLTAFRALGPVFILAEGWDPGGLAAGLSRGTPAVVNTAAAAATAVQLAQAGLDCLLLLHEMPDYLHEQGLMPDLRRAKALGARLVASMPRMAEALAEDPGGVGQLLPGIVPPPTPQAAFRHARMWRRAGLGPVFIGAGHADRRKGFDLFLEAARGISGVQPDARFVWLGALDDWSQELADRAMAEGLALTLPGFVAGSLAWYRAADVYLLTSRQDPGPTTAIHAAAVGTPFVGYAADIGLIGLTEGVGCFVPPGDAAGFAAQALELATTLTPANRRTLRRHIRQMAGFDRYVTAILCHLDRAGDDEA